MPSCEDASGDSVSVDESEIFVSYKVSFFFLSNLAFTVMAFILLCDIYSNHRQLLVKPSFWLVVYSHVFFQWPLALLSNTCERWMPNPYTLSLLVNGFVFAGISLSYLTFRQAASDVYNRLTALDTRKDAPYYNAGERTGFLNILIVTAFVYLLRKNFSINMKWAVVVPLLALTPPVLLSIIREDKTSTMD